MNIEPKIKLDEIKIEGTAVVTWPEESNDDTISSSLPERTT